MISALQREFEVVTISADIVLNEIMSFVLDLQVAALDSGSHLDAVKHLFKQFQASRDLLTYAFFFEQKNAYD